MCFQVRWIYITNTLSFSFLYNPFRSLRPMSFQRHKWTDDTRGAWKNNTTKISTDAGMTKLNYIILTYLNLKLTKKNPLLSWHYFIWYNKFKEQTWISIICQFTSCAQNLIEKTTRLLFQDIINFNIKLQHTHQSFLFQPPWMLFLLTIFTLFSREWSLHLLSII